MLAGWLETYAEAMELNVWTGTELAGGTFDAASRTLDGAAGRPGRRARAARRRIS